MRSPSHPALDAESREYRPWSADLFIITFFSLPNRLRCGHPVIPHSDVVAQSSRAPTRDPENTGKFTRKILFPGPRITCGVTRFSTRYPGYTRCLYPKKTAGSTVRATGEHGLPFSFPAKEKGKSKESFRLMSES